MEKGGSGNKVGILPALFCVLLHVLVVVYTFMSILQVDYQDFTLSGDEPVYKSQEGVHPWSPSY